MWGLKAISEWERILLAWFLDALLFIRILWKCVKWQNQFQKEHGSVSKSLKPGMWKSSVHSCTMASKKQFMAIPTPMILPLFETKRLECFMTKHDQAKTKLYKPWSNSAFLGLSPRWPSGIGYGEPGGWSTAKRREGLAYVMDHQFYENTIPRMSHTSLETIVLSWIHSSWWCIDYPFFASLACTALRRKGCRAFWTRCKSCWQRCATTPRRKWRTQFVEVKLRDLAFKDMGFG